MLWFADVSENYQPYQHFLNSIIGGIFGLIIIITVFYLGKIHDYKKDFLKIESKIKMSHNLYSKKCDCLKFLTGMMRQRVAQIPLQENSIKKNCNEIYERSDKLLKNTKLEDNVTKFIEIIEEVFKLSHPIREFVIVALPFVAVFIFNLLPKYTDGVFYFQLSVIGSGIVNLLVWWKINEHIMQLFHRLYSNLLDISIFIQEMHYDVDDHISNVKIIQDEIEQIS